MPRPVRILLLSVVCLAAAGAAVVAREGLASKPAGRTNVLPFLAAPAPPAEPGTLADWAGLPPPTAPQELQPAPEPEAPPAAPVDPPPEPASEPAPATNPDPEPPAPTTSGPAERVADPPPAEQPPAPPAAPAAQAVAPAPTAAPPPRSAPSADADLSSMESTLFELHNKERAGAGVGPLALDATLCAVARARAQDMAAKGYFAHTSPSGETAFDLMAQAGYRFRMAAENIARNDYPAGQAASVAMSSFMASSGHRANILNSGYRRGCVGYAGAGRVHYFAVVFSD